MIPIKFTLALFLFTLCFSTYSAESAPVTLTGAWAGTWSDQRPGYNGSGGSFTGTMVEKGTATWAGQFSLGKSITFDVELKGQPADGKVEFDTTVNLGKVHGIYTIKGSATADVMSGSYVGPGEKGTFTMKRIVADAKSPPP